MSRIIAGKMIVGDDELHFRDDDAQKKLKDLIVQGKGDSETAVMSQAAATEEFDKLSEEKVDKNSVVQSSGDSESVFMSQKATTNAVMATITDEIQEIPLTFKVGYIKRTTGLPILSDVMFSTWRICDSIPCAEGDVFVYNGTMAGLEACGCSFFTENYNHISTDIFGKEDCYIKYNNHLVKAPKNAKWVIFCFEVDEEETDGVCTIHKIRKSQKDYPNEKTIKKDEAEVYTGGYYKRNGAFTTDTRNLWKYTSLTPVNEGDKVFYTGCIVGLTQPLYLFDENRTPIKPLYQEGDTTRETGIYYYELEYVVEQGVKFVGASFCNEDTYDLRENKVNKLVVYRKTEHNSVSKTMVWFGTSIPHGYPKKAPFPYPELVGEKLGIKVYNEAEPSSAARAGDYKKVSESDPLGWSGAVYDHIARAFSHTIAEKRDFIDNYQTKWRALLGGNPPATVTDEDYILSCSYENKLLKYLDGGSVGNVDYYVFDHGHNDGYDRDYHSGEDLCAIPTDRFDRTYFIGAMGFLFNQIFMKNPKARIILIGHYEKSVEEKKIISEAQEKLASLWNLPLNKTWEKVGWSQNTVKTTGYWNNNRWVDSGGTERELTFTQIYMPDNLHPGSDADGKANEILAEVHAGFIRQFL